MRLAIERLIRERGLDLELRTWEDLALRYHQVRELFGRIFAVLTLIVSIMVVFGITNTMTMAIFERTREIGTIMALGTRRRGVISMFVLEGIALGALGGLIGVVLGVILAKAISTLGIQLPPPPGSTRGSPCRSSSSPACWRRRSVSRSSPPRWPRSIRPGAPPASTSWRRSAMYSFLGGGFAPFRNLPQESMAPAKPALEREGIHGRGCWMFAALILLSLARSVGAEEAEEIVRRADLARRPGESFVWKVTVTSAEGGKAPTTDGFEVFVKGTRQSFVKFVAPPRNVGRSLLALDRDLWIYLPDAGRPVRIPLAQRLVGQVANGDLARVDYAGDYDVTLLGTETVDGVACHVLDLKARTEDVTYAAIKYWVARDEPRPVKAEFYAGTGTLLKTGSFDPPRDVGGRRLVPRLTFVDAIRKDRKSVMDFGEVKVRDLPDKYFDKNYMKTLD